MGIISATDKIDIIESNQGYSMILDYVDLFDEGRFGADKLFLRGSFAHLSSVRDQVKSFLTSTEDTDEEGNPLPPYATPAIAREIADKNRLFEPNRKIWKLSNAANEKFPLKARYRLMFFIKLHFNKDFAYIWFGVPWTNTKAIRELEAGILSETYELNDLELLKHSWISPEDAETIVNYIADKADTDPAVQMLSALSSISDTEISL